MASDNSPPPSSGPSSSNQGTFERWRRRFSAITGVGMSEQERRADLQVYQHETCEKWKRELMSNSPGVTFMLENLKRNGCDVKPENIICAPCISVRSGGFSPDAGAITLCEERIMHKQHMEDTVMHELVHMYDHCKFKVDWNNLRHHACSEIRANSLSGDCKFTRELRRGFVSFSKQHQACVRRRAVLSVRANPACPDDATAERAVNEVWESCFNDTRPFDEIF
ncbi:hypothetical protein PHLGIDRAFT_99235 [Phlebiopsis gigantea 11061_1 CR5-6]|uniref:Mitochondrial inner membrane protease ATP23 n=1 Tax=Phlebiopsis gigantea (strain 11061_1 CR5-6) TaxID=745531 RepID=A0A0C3P1Q3_PHLG1|nr:hypothetical protein PHLGIDRAFT_99235 [Phlebiopsis gigantea 11061_1 CR5-6]